MFIIVAFILLLISIAMRVLFGYLAVEYTFLEPTLIWLTVICVVMAAVFVVSIIVRIVNEVRK